MDDLRPPLVSDPASLTPEWITAALHAAGLGRGGRVAAATCDPVGTGQMARSFRFRLEWTGDPGNAPRSVVAKLPSDDPTSRATGAMHGAYRKEVRFYQEIARTVGIRTPRCWYAEIDDGGEHFALLLEDVVPAVQGDQLAGCSVEQAALALDELAKLHAPHWGDPALERLDFLADPPTERARVIHAIYEAVWPGFRQRYEGRLEPRLMALAERFGPRCGDWVLGTRSLSTVTHGDYRLDNMLFGITGGAAPPLAVVDWQTTSRGLGTADASYFLGAGLRVENRRRHERDLLRAYHERLGSLGVTGYSFEECWQDYRYTAFAGVVMAVIAPMLVEQTPRGDDMFMAMASRHAEHALDLDAEDLLR